MLEKIVEIWDHFHQYTQQLPVVKSFIMVSLFFGIGTMCCLGFELLLDSPGIDWMLLELHSASD